MKPLKKNLSVNFKAARLTLTELKYMVTQAEQLGMVVEISDEDNIFASLAELQQYYASKKIKYFKLTFSRENDYASLIFDQFGWRFDSNNSTIGQQLHSVVDTTIRKYMSMGTNLINPGYVALFCLVLLFSFLFVPRIIFFEFGIYMIILVFGIMFSCWNLYGKYNSLCLQERNKIKGFWTRNQDKIWILLIGAIIGCFGTLTTQWLSAKLNINSSTPPAQTTAPTAPTKPQLQPTMQAPNKSQATTTPATPNNK